MSLDVFKIKRNDTLPVLQVNLTSTGNLGEKTEFDITDVDLITFTMVKTKCNTTKIFEQSATTTCASGSTFEYAWQDGDTDEAGEFLGEFELNFSNGKRLSVPSMGGILIEILEDLNNFN